MRNWIIKHLLLGYDTKVFGKYWKHRRTANVALPLLVVAGLFNILTVGFGIWEILSLVPFVVVFFSDRFISFEVKELDWEQRLQYYKKHNLDVSERKQLQDRHDAKYGGSEKFVKAWRFFFPLICIILALVLYGIFGFNEAGFNELRFF